MSPTKPKSVRRGNLRRNSRRKDRVRYIVVDLNYYVSRPMRIKLKYRIWLN